MPRKKFIEEKLRSVDAEVGDTIKIIGRGRENEGVLMPHHEFSGDDIVNIKLKNGYNMGVSVDTSTNIVLVKKHTTMLKKSRKIPHDPKKPTVSVIGTGGTIACYIDYRTGAVHPATSSQELAFSVPEIFDICNVKTQVAYQLVSENIEVHHWQRLAQMVAKELNNEARGVVIPHGTDTLGYSAAALSFMLKDLSGPVVLVGAQRSSDRPSSDAAQNLIGAATIASQSDIGEVVVTMHGDISDTISAIHRGTKVRKLHTSRRDAFRTVNDNLLGTIENGRINIDGPYKKKTSVKVTVDYKMEQDVGIIYSYPRIKKDDIPYKKGIVLVGTGLGHIPNKIIPKVKELIKNGTVVVMTSQCIFGRVNMRVYSNGRDLIKAGVISGEDMLPETAYVKLMWALAHGTDNKEVEQLMLTNIAGEISKRTEGFFKK
ncbi:MAG: Glu-tRNA(Gln) amidotransferase subunit GatD [Petrotogales bacterium]